VGALSAARRIAVLISGQGSNLRALIEAAGRPSYPAEIVLVISNRPDAAGLGFAREAGIAARVIDHTAFADRPAFERAMTAAIEKADAELVCNAGFRRLLTATFVERWRDRQLNIHPSLLPAYKGLHSHERVIADGTRISGCTVHFVREEMDSGPIVAQAAVAVEPSDTAGTLAARVLEVEHRLYPHALGLVASGRAWVEGERTVFGRSTGAAAPLFSPGLER
jgi:phosphoribosylglycinamide formyltransferase-1